MRDVDEEVVASVADQNYFYLDSDPHILFSDSDTDSDSLDVYFDTNHSKVSF
jgi:hypothetical protein